MTEIVSKSEFARLIGVSAARVSQMIGEGKIDGSALVGSGRMAKISVAVACEQVRMRTDIGQSLANGFNTKLHASDGDLVSETHQIPQAASATSQQLFPKTDEQIRRDKLEEYKLREAARKDRAGEEEELKRAGTLIMRDDAVSEIESIVATIYDQMDGAPDRMGQLMAAEFEMTNLRDVVFFMRRMFRDLKDQIADELNRMALDADEVISVPLPGDGIDDAEASQSKIAMADCVTENEATTEAQLQ